MKYKLCPHCQLNYIDCHHDMCVVCGRQKIIDCYSDRELCPYCNKNIILNSQPMCDYCWSNRYKDE